LLENWGYLDGGSGQVIEVVLSCVLRVTTKKGRQLGGREKCTPRQNPGYAYGVRCGTDAIGRLLKACLFEDAARSFLGAVFKFSFFFTYLFTDFIITFNRVIEDVFGLFQTGRM